MQVLKVNLKILIVLLLVATQAGCIKIEKEYYWDRNENERFTLRWQINDKHNLVLLNSYISNGDTQSYISDYFTKCQFYDDKNWKCGTISESESISMTNGKLHWHYWSEERAYKSTYRVFFN
jgi:hypothetical protein